MKKTIELFASLAWMIAVGVVSSFSAADTSESERAATYKV